MAESVTNQRNIVPPARLWFGLTGCAAAWVVLGAGDILITWWACTENQPFGGDAPRPYAAILYVIATLLLIGAAIVSGFTSYRNWRKLSEAATLGEAEGQGRREFMALLGVFVSATLGMGLIWLTVPLFILHLCVRAR
jgi:hypothetical protein